jgi:hypothetical protein
MTNMCVDLLIFSARHAKFSAVNAIYVLLALGIFSSVAFAEDWTTTDGTKYQNVRVIRVEDDAITILYKDGGALVPIMKLPPKLQQKFDYDPVKAKVAADARAKEDVENAKKLQAEIELANKMKQSEAVKDAAARGYPTNTTGK